MVSGISNVPGELMDPTLFSAKTASASIDPTVSFEQQLESALESYLGQSENGSQLSINLPSNLGQESGSGQNLVTLKAPPVATPDTTPVANTMSTAEDTTSTTTTTPTTTPTTPTILPASWTLSTGPGLSAVMQGFESDWSVLTPQQVAFQLANASGAGGGNPTDTVPGTSMTFGQLNQTQQEAYQYALNYGTGGLSMQDFLTQNAGPQAAWNMSYDQSQTISAIESAVDPSYLAAADGVPTLIQAPAGDPPAASGNADNLPNPAMIQYLPQSQQAAAEAAVAAEGLYGDKLVAAANAYAAA
jgi:hypothetical protein